MGKIGLHPENNASSPALGGSPTPLRVRWWLWCCFHCPLQPTLGTWWQRCQNRGMESGFSKLGWNIKNPDNIRAHHPEESGHHAEWMETLKRFGIIPASSRWVDVAGITYGNPTGHCASVERRAKTGSFRDACASFCDGWIMDAMSGDDKGGSQPVSL